jgi:uncharacterized protein YbcI
MTTSSVNVPFWFARTADKSIRARGASQPLTRYRRVVSIEPDQAARTGGQLAEQISSSVVKLIKEHGDRGPTKCRTYIDDDLIIVLMRGGYSRLENTLFEDGKWLDVRSTRQTFHDTMEGRFTDTIERLSGREVSAFMSASHQRPDMQIAMFVLDRRRDEAQSSADPAVS